MKFSIIDFFSFLRIWLHLLNKSLMENFIFRAVSKVLNDCDIKTFLSEFQKYFVTVTIDNASYNLLLIFESFL